MQDPQYQPNVTPVRAGDSGQTRITANRELIVSVSNTPATLGPQTPANSLSVIESGLQYETVAAGQTAQVLGSTGAIGDYLSHVVFQPTALGAGTSTVIDNATVAFTYTAGTLSDLRPITVVMNAFSVSGPWKITTGANMTATAFGKWT